MKSALWGVGFAMLWGCGGPIKANGDAGTELGDSDLAAAPAEVETDDVDASTSEDDDGCLALADELATPPATLSATGCFLANAPTTAASRLIPYDVNAPLWSDGATKRRWMALPKGAQVHIGADGDWDFPNGTVLVKEFSVSGKRVETRLLMRNTNGSWLGLSYEWNSAETDAALVASSGKSQASPAWSFPSRGQCMTCHTQQAGFSLGLETAQLNRTFDYPGATSANQLETLDHLGVFDAPLSAPAAQLPAYPKPDDLTQPLQNRARAYLHANCSQCHRPPSGPYSGQPDFRYQTPFSTAGICNATPHSGSAGMKIIAPGQPSSSVVSLRMHSATSRMPPLGTSIIDTDGVGIIDAWIASLTTCP